MTRLHTLMALGLLCCASFHLALAGEFRAPRWRAQALVTLVIAAAELAAAVLLMFDAAREG